MNIGVDIDGVLNHFYKEYYNLYIILISLNVKTVLFIYQKIFS